MALNGAGLSRAVFVCAMRARFFLFFDKNMKMKRAGERMIKVNEP
jgi:hypothetical protein